MIQLAQMPDDNSRVTIKNILRLFSSGKKDDVSRELLSHSLFYYCSGKDPSPIIAFEDQFPLYIYADLRTEPEALYQRLSERGFTLMDSKIGENHSCAISVWTGESGRPFGLLYVQDNANSTYLTLFSDTNDQTYNLLLPKAVCNQRYGMPNWEYTVLPSIEKRTEYIIGYCFNSKYRQIGYIDYYGDYGSDSGIAVFRRKYYYN